jgi:hypothetical protein
MGKMEKCGMHKERHSSEHSASGKKILNNMYRINVLIREMQHVQKPG